MKYINSILATFQYELSRVMTPQRFSVAVIMTLFPPTMVFVLGQSELMGEPTFMISILCGMVCLLSLLLWATPNVSAELEGRSWTFVTSRPGGRWSIFFGKYLIAFAWSFLVSWLALSLCIILVEPGLWEPFNRLRVWIVFSGLLCLASLSYAAIFSFFGVLFQRRAMVVAVGYFLVFEILLAMMPANIGKITLDYHLFCLSLIWIGWVAPGDNMLEGNAFQQFYGLYPWWVHLSALFLASSAYLGLAAFIIRIREYVTLEDSQV